VDYENDLSLLVVTSATSDGEGYKGTITFHDNDTGVSLAHVDLIEPWKEASIFCTQLHTK